VLDACGAAPATPPPPDAATAAAAAAPLGAATVLWRHMLGSEVRPTERELVSLAEAAARHAEAGGALERAAAAAALSSALRDAARCLRQVGIVDAAFDLSPPAAAAVADAARRVGAADATAEARVDGGTAACGACGGYLSAARLSEADAAAARGRLLGAAEQARPGFAIELERMCKWIDSRGFTVLIDGPNLAYAGQNSPLGGRFSVAQIDAAVGALKAHGETPLVILPGRYKGPQIRNSARLPNEYLETQKHHRGEGGEWRMTAYTPKERATLVDWAANGEVSWVRSTPGHFDDWVWMLSTISDAANASRPDRVAERPVRALTNDLCLDHRNLEYVWVAVAGGGAGTPECCNDDSCSSALLLVLLVPLPLPFTTHLPARLSPRYFAPRAFSQWANERLIRYSVVNPEKADGAVPRGTLPSVLLARPPAAGAEVQRCDAGEWHAPVAGSTAWLCTTGLAAAAGDGGDAAVDALGGPWKGLLGT
jgi:hypothetical protein